MSLLPLVIATPLLGLFMNLDGRMSLAVALTLLVGTPALTFIGLIGAALTPVPTIVVNFRSFASDCQRTRVLCAREIADTRLQAGQGMHGRLPGREPGRR